MASFTKKRINIRFDLTTGVFAGGGNKYEATGLRISVSIQNNGGLAQSKGEFAIYGLPLDVMNQLSTVGTQYNKEYKNGVAIEAGDDESGMTLIFAGVITSAFVDAQAMPQVNFHVTAISQTFYSVKPAEPLSIKGSADVSGMLSQIASAMGFAYEDAGVNVKLANPYYAGSLWQQALQIARHAGIDVVLDKNTLVAIPPDKSRQSDTVLISPETGLVGYPAFNQRAVVVAALFNPAVQYGANFEVRSELTPANGIWKINSLVYELESEMPQGNWFMILQGYLVGPETIAGT